MTLTYHNDVSIAELVVYVPCFLVAVSLALKHGFKKSSGWYFLVVLSLARIIGASMQLATINDPTNVSLLTGVSILQSIGLSPLIMATLGLLSRLIESINRSHTTVINPSMLKFVETLVFVALILGISGGTNSSSHLQKTGEYRISDLTKAATALYIASFVFIVLTAITTSTVLSHAESGEKRILLAVTISLPFVFVRLLYTVIATFAHLKSFSLFGGNITVLLCMAILEEIIVVVVYEIMGLTLRKTTQLENVEAQHEAGHHHIPSDGSSNYQVPAQKKENVALRIFKRTIIGRIVFAFIPDVKTTNRDVAMEESLRK